MWIKFKLNGSGLKFTGHRIDCKSISLYKNNSLISNEEEGFPFHIFSMKRKCNSFRAIFQEEIGRSAMKNDQSVHQSVCTSAGDWTTVKRERTHQKKKVPKNTHQWVVCSRRQSVVHCTLCERRWCFSPLCWTKHTLCSPHQSIVHCVRGGGEGLRPFRDPMQACGAF